MSDAAKTCKHCGQPFERGHRTPFNFRRAKFCGQACSFAWRKFTPDRAIEAFWGRVQKSGTCWIYTGAKDATGYGYLHNPLGNGPKFITAHRYSWVLANGPVPPGLHVLHRCDVHACCNPAHLFVGTHAENMADCKAKGRTTRGERNKRNVLTEAQVLEIRANPPKLGRGLREINEYAVKYGVSKGTIYCSMTKRTWKHLP